MRQDLSKVIVERPRQKPRAYGRGQRIAQQRLERCDALPSKAPMKPFPAYTRKEKSDLLGPLKKFLVTQAERGRTWDEVYSELSARWSRNGKTWPHLQHHAVDLVARHVRLIDGTPHPAYHDKRTDFDDEVVWVHPETGVLMPMPPRNERPGWKVATLYRSPNSRFVLLSGVWKIVVLAELPRLNFGALPEPVTVERETVTDCVLGSIKVGYGTIGRAQAELLWHGDYYGVRLLGLGRKEQHQLQQRLGTPLKRRRERQNCLRKIAH